MAKVLNEPTNAGYELGYHMSRFFDAAELKPERCATCAFRQGTYPNGCEATLMDAMKSVLDLPATPKAPAPKPSFTVEKSVSESLNAPYPRVRLTCKPRPGYRSFLLPDESTGEKVCLNVLKEKP